MAFSRIYFYRVKTFVVAFVDESILFHVTACHSSSPRLFQSFLMSPRYYFNSLSQIYTARTILSAFASEFYYRAFVIVFIRIMKIELRAYLVCSADPPLLRRISWRHYPRFRRRRGKTTAKVGPPWTRPTTRSLAKRQDHCRYSCCHWSPCWVFQIRVNWPCFVAMCLSHCCRSLSYSFWNWRNKSLLW